MRSLLLLLAATLLALLGAESLLRAWRPDASRCTLVAEAAKCRAALAAGRHFDSRTRLEVIQELANRGVNAWPGVKPDDVLTWGWSIRHGERELLPLAGISRATTVYCNESGDWISFESDEHGFRNPLGLHTRDSVEIVVIGDSVAQGYCVAEQDQVAAQLRLHYPATLDLGMDSNGPLLELATLREYAAPLAPRLVLWLFNEENDLANLAGELTHPLVRAYLDANHGVALRLSQEQIDRQLRDAVSRARPKQEAREAVLRRRHREAHPEGIADFFGLRELRRRLTLLRTGPPRPSHSLVQPGAVATEADLLALRRVLEQARGDVSSWGGRLVVAYLPSWGGLTGVEGAELQHRRVLALVGDLRITVIDVRAAFSAQPDPRELFPFGLPGHYDARGHRLLAETLLDGIRESGW